jgi:hypothetical protein
MNWTPDRMDRLERAIVDESRVQISRRGTLYVVVPRALRSEGGAEVLVGSSYTGDDLRFALDEIESFEVIS